MNKELSRKSLVAAALFSAMVIGSTPLPAQADSETIGTLGGAAAGGFIGNQFGQGDGKIAATVGGVIAGGIIGNAIGRDADQSRYYGPPPTRSYSTTYYEQPTYYAPPPRTVVVRERPVYYRPAPVVYYEERRPRGRYRYYRGW